MNDFTIREMIPEEYSLLEDFLYEAIFVAEDYKGEVPKNIVYDDPLCLAGIKDFGLLPDDYALVVDVDSVVVGACWAGIRNEYGHIDDKTPSLSISLFAEYRGRGIGTALMDEMVSLLRDKGYSRVSLSVQKENRSAVRVYEKCGFEIIGDGVDETEWLMILEV